MHTRECEQCQLRRLLLGETSNCEKGRICDGRRRAAERSAIDAARVEWTVSGGAPSAISRCCIVFETATIAVLRERGGVPVGILSKDRALADVGVVEMDDEGQGHAPARVRHRHARLAELGEDRLRS